MVNRSLHLLVVEVSVGMITIILAFLTAALLRYAWQVRRGNGDVSAARNVAVGLSLIFGPLAVRGAGTWFILWRANSGVPIPSYMETLSPAVQVVTVTLVALGSIVCLREFYRAATAWTLIMMLALILPAIALFTYIV